MAAVTAFPEMTVGFPKEKRWTRADVARMADAGILVADEFELLDGRLVSTMGKGRLHVIAVRRLAAALKVIFGEDFVDQEAPIDVSSADLDVNEPEPDAVVLRRPALEILDRNPQPEEVRLVAEVAATSLTSDLGWKAGLYARAGIEEYWVVDLAARRLLVHREPQGGRYAEVAVLGENEAVAIGAETVEVRRLLLEVRDERACP
jgi:Uma2 family endonuclease